jgi:hypothetical protein
MPGTLWWSAKKCWLFGEHLREWTTLHPIAKDRITYTDAELAEMLAYARRRAENTGAGYAGLLCENPLYPTAWRIMQEY